MIYYSEIQSASVQNGVSIEVIEKDYHLEWYLSALWEHPIISSFLFYGGTAIKKLFLPKHRFSEDIDLISGKRFSIQELKAALFKIHEALQNHANLFFFWEDSEIKTLGTQTRFLIHYRGFSEVGGMKRFLLDFAQGIESLPEPVEKTLIASYRDLRDRSISIKTLPLEVICAEKLALITDRKRKEPRDVYDLWAVFRNMKKFDSKLFFSRYQWRLSYVPELSIIQSTLKDSVYESAWEHRLRYQVPALPKYDLVVMELVEFLRKIWPIRK